MPTIPWFVLMSLFSGPTAQATPVPPPTAWVLNSLAKAESMQETLDIVQTYRRKHLVYLRGLALNREKQPLSPGVEVRKDIIAVNGEKAAEMLPVLTQLFFLLDNIAVQSRQRDAHIAALGDLGMNQTDLNVLAHATATNFNRAFWTLKRQKEAAKDSPYRSLLKGPKVDGALSDDAVFGIWMLTHEIGDDTEAAMMWHVLSEMSLSGRRVLLAYACEQSIKGTFGFYLKALSREALITRIRDGSIMLEGGLIEESRD